jgi:CBS domain-containing protein
MRLALVRRTQTIAHVWGTPLQVHWSLYPIFVLVVLLCSIFFAVELPFSLALSAGLGTALLLYGAIFLHELAHGVAGHMAGLPIRSITLFGFGGRTEVDESRLVPLVELLVAAAGPLMSLLLTLIWGVAFTLSEAGLFQTIALTQAWVNGGMLALNLLPGYPLDGGRMLKASLWFLGDEEMPAARSATLIACACSWGLLAVAAVYALSSGDFAYALLLGMAGFFLGQTAVTGYRQLTLQRALRGVRVADVMLTSFRGVEPDLPLDQFVGRFVLGQADTCFPVTIQPDEEHEQPLLGMMTMRNLRRFAISQWTRTSIREAMTPAERVCTLSPETSADDALRMLIEQDHDLLPVVGNARLLGVIRRRDLLLHIQMKLARM